MGVDRHRFWCTVLAFYLERRQRRSTATYVSADTFTVGNAYSLGPNLVTLASGAIVGTWYQGWEIQPTQVIWALPIGVLGALQHYSQNRTSDGSAGFGAKYTMAQHPADNSLWIFNSEDNAEPNGLIYYVKCTESGGALTVGAWDTLLTSGNNGLNPYGGDDENPSLVACPDPTRNVIQLAYVSNNPGCLNYTEAPPDQRDLNPDPPPFYVCSYLVITAVAANASFTYITMPYDRLDAVEGFGFVVTPSTWYVFYRPIDTNYSYNNDFIRTYTPSTTTWSNRYYVGYNVVPGVVIDGNTWPAEGNIFDTRCYGAVRPISP